MTKYHHIAYIIPLEDQRMIAQGLAEINLKLLAGRLVVLNLRRLLIERIGA